MHARQAMWVGALCAALLGVLISPLQAIPLPQQTTGTISGRIVDSQGLAVPGVTVTITGAQGTRTAVTDGDGRYNVPFLVPGPYTVRAELQGFKSAEQTNVNVILGQTATTNFGMEIGAMTEMVQVSGAAAAIDLRTTTTGAVLSSDMLTQIPVGRRITDTLYVAPGVSSGGSVGSANPSMAGGSGLDNLYVVDGVNISNGGYGAIGSYSIVFGSLGTAMPFDFAEEVQVKTGGYEAEFGQSMGGVVNIITKSGTNQLRGATFGYFSPDELQSDWRTVQTPNGTVNTVGTQNWDYGASAGFPIIRDRLFAFVAANPGHEQRTFIAPAGFPLEALGPQARERDLFSYSAKATWKPGTRHSIDVSFFGDPSSGDMGPQRTSSMDRTTTSAFSEIEYGGHNQTVRYDGILRSSWLVEAAFARAKNTISETPLRDEWLVRDLTVVPNVNTGGIGIYEAGNDSRNLQYTLKSTNLFKGHQVRYGLLFEDVKFSQVQRRTGPPILAADGRMTASGVSVDIISDPTYEKVYRVVRALFNETRDTQQDYLSFFVQDSWTAGSRLTVNAGLRYEQESLVGAFDSLPTLDGGSVDNLTMKNNWAPRIGFVYDVTGGGRSKLYANYGRFFARIPSDLAARVLSADETISRGDYFDAALTQPIPDGVLAGGVDQHFIAPGGGQASTFIDPDAKLSFKDEFVTGFEYALKRNLSLGIRYTHRNIGRVLEDVGLYPHVACDLGSEGACNFDTYVITNPDQNTKVIIDVPELEGQGIAFEKPIHKYDAIELTMDRRFARNWALLASYRWSRLWGNYEGFYREDNGQSDPAITSLYDFPTNDPTYTSIGVPQFHYEGDVRFLGRLGAGPLPLDRPHQIKVFGNYLFGMGLGVGLGITGTSGKPLTALASHPNYGTDSEIPMTVRAAGFETVDGFRERTPSEWDVNMQASYSFRFAGERRITLLADAFNLFNVRRPIDYNSAVDTSFGAGPNPDFGTQTSENVAGQMFQQPFRLRLGARLQFLVTPDEALYGQE